MPEDPKNPYEVRQDCLFGPGLDEETGVDVTHFRWPSDFEGLAHDIYRYRDLELKEVTLQFKLQACSRELAERKVKELKNELNMVSARNQVLEQQATHFKAKSESLELAGGRAMSAALAAKEELILGGNWAMAANVIAQAKKLWDERIK